MLCIGSSRPTKQSYLDIANAQAKRLKEGLQELSPGTVDPNNTQDCDRILTGLKELKKQYVTLREYAHEYAHNDRRRCDPNHPETTVWGIKNEAKVEYTAALKGLTDALEADLKKDIACAEFTFDNELLKPVETMAQNIREVDLDSKKKKVGYLDKEISEARQRIDTFMKLDRIYRDVAQSGNTAKLQELTITPVEFLKGASKAPNTLDPEHIMPIRAERLTPLATHCEHVELQKKAQNAVSQYSRAVHNKESADSAYAKTLIARLEESENLLQPRQRLSPRLWQEVKKCAELLKRRHQESKDEIEVWERNGVNYAPEGSSALKRMHSLERKIADDELAPHVAG